MRPDIKLKNKSGIYCIKNTINNKVYIGRTKCFYRRCHQYLYDFKSRSIGHLNDYLFNSLRKYGIENFTFTVVEYCTLDQIQEKELFWIKSFESTVSKKGYNLRLDVNGSMKTDGRTSDKISKRLKREWSQGVRKDHSLKLRMSWKKRDRSKQRELFSKTLTRYVYIVEGEHLRYRDLLDRGLKSVLSNFHRRKSDKVIHKGVVVERVSYGKA